MSDELTVDDALKIVHEKSECRTRYAGQSPFLDEILAAEIERLRMSCAELTDNLQKYQGRISGEHVTPHCSCVPILRAENERLRIRNSVLEQELTAAAAAASGLRYPSEESQPAECDLQIVFDGREVFRQTCIVPAAASSAPELIKAGWPWSMRPTPIPIDSPIKWTSGGVGGR